MSMNEQIATMIAENMQRADLTIPEQVHGIQMMLNLGESLEEVQKKTGLSRSTVYHRKAMAALPANELQKSWERGGTLADYIKLEQIRDLQVRTNLLNFIGTSDFNYKLRQAKGRQDFLELLKDVQSLLEPVAKKLKQKPNKTFWQYIYLYKNCISNIKDAVAKIEADSETDYSFFLDNSKHDYGYLYIYRDVPEPEKVKSPEELAREKKEQARKQRLDSLQALHKSFQELRIAFIREFRETAADLHSVVSVFLAYACYIDAVDVMCHVFGSKGESDALIKMYKKFCVATPAAVMLGVMEMEMEEPYDGWNGAFVEADEDSDPEPYLRLLRKLGYQMSNDEKAYWYGAHELFYKEDEDNV